MARAACRTGPCTTCAALARSLLSRAGVDADIAERCITHVIPGVRATYDRHKYIGEMCLAFEALAAQIDRIVNPQPNVVPLRGEA